MSFEIMGKIVAKYNTVQRSETFKTREFVIEKSEDINGRVITNYVKFQLVQDRCSIIDRYNEGDMVKVSFNIKGSRWEKEGKVNYITNLDAWRLELATGAGAPAASGGSFTDRLPDYGGSQERYNPSQETVDDLPF